MAFKRGDMRSDIVFWWVLVALLAVGLIVCGLLYRIRSRRLHAHACFEAMLCMLLQPTPANIATVDQLLSKKRISEKRGRELLYEAEMEADCLSMMPTGEMRSSQPFLERRYSQILAKAEINGALATLIKSRLESF
jgi:hypothetical protein